ncbi:MAG TPA: carboxypeptidase regulatory-like domain-containing protein [Terracidiphilus sp.]
MRFFWSFLNALFSELVILGVLGIVSLAGVPRALCQVTTAAIHGIVTDPSGAVVPGAKITALNTQTGITAVTTANQSGYYSFPSLQVGGPYRVIVEARGFKRYESTGVMLTVNSNLEVGAKLTLGASSQTVTVNASAVQVETANTQLQQVVPASQIEVQPLFGRDAASLQKLMPGTVEASDRFGSFSENGSQTTNNSYQLEGIDNNDGPLQDEGLVINPDALQEQNTVTSTINPQFARNGGAVINQVVKAGTNHVHGSAFEYYRDTFLNNGGYFALPGERPPFHQNLFGGTLGFPLVKSKLFGFLSYQGYRNRTGQTTQTPVFQSGLLTSGDFSNENNTANDGPNGTVGLSSNPIPFPITTGSGTACGPGTAYPNWSDCFPAGSPVVISPASFNSLAVALTKQFVPAGNTGSATAPLYNFNTADTGAQDQGVMRLDYHISSNDSIYGVGIFQSSPASNTLPFGGANLPGFRMVNAEHYKLFSAQETHTFNPTTLNVLRAGYYRLNYAAVEPAKPVAPSTYGFNINPQSSSSGLPNIDLTGLFTIGFSYEGPQPRKDTNLTFSDNFTHVMGNHDLQIGVTVEQFRVSNPYYADNNGDYTFDGSGTYSSGDPGIDFLLGIPDNYAQSSGGFVDAIAWEDYAYAQDSWHATPDLTLNYGLAWDAETPNKNMQYKGLGITCFQLSGATSSVFPGGFPGLLFPGDPGCNQAGGATTKYHHFAPRFGFAWSPTIGPSAIIGNSGSHRFSVRGGFGLYYNRDAEEGQLQNLGDVPNYLFSLGAGDFGGSPGFADPFTDVAGAGSEPNPFPYVRPRPGTPLDWSTYAGQDISNIDPNYSVPYIFNFNLNIQRQLPSNMILQIGYVGSLGRRLPLVYEGDPITAAGHAACLADATCVQHRSRQHLYFPDNAAQPATTDGIPDYLSVGTIGTYGASSYNSLQMLVTKNTTHGLYFTLAYTYSHGLDNSSGLESSGFNGLGYNWVPGYQYLSYGDSDYDARHRFVASYDYQVPLLASMRNHLAIKEVLGGWHLAGYTALQSGFPVTITNAGTYNSLWCDAFTYYSCPDNVETSSFRIAKFDPRADAVTHKYFDASPFSQEPIGTFGNAKRNFFHGPGYNYSNMNLYKSFPLGRESRTLQLMLQAQNVFNHANFAMPDSNFTDGPLFGQVLGVDQSADPNGDPAPGRTVQLAGRFTF